MADECQNAVRCRWSVLYYINSVMNFYRVFYYCGGFDCYFQELRKSVERALVELRSEKTIAVLIFGIIKHNYPSDLVAETVIGTILEFLSRTPTTKMETVEIVVDPKQKNTHQVTLLLLFKTET